ncbi:MAG: mandelate racemase/muconate lactonizing enzyme family protein [Chthonomonadales bacterium]|nr:mandelate racemase/muconate lactonizing enzyme family protein [Chthonomonadales bacterium]
MKITAITATPVRLDIPYPLYPGEGAGTKIEWGKRSRFTPLRPTPMLEYVLVRVETDAGITGWGEAQADIGFFGETVEQVRAAVADYMGPQLIGQDPLDREYLHSVIAYRGNGCAKSGIDMALHDLAGRVMGVPVSTLLGGRRRTRVPVAIEVPGGSPDAMAKACADLMVQGVRAFKPKVGGYPDADADRLRAIREAVGPDVSIRADANQGYSPKEAIRLCRLCERHGVGLELLEQPVAAHDLAGMAFVRRSVDTLIEADESCFTPQDALAIIRHEAADVLNIKRGKAGGFIGAKKIAALAEAAGLKCVLGTAFGLGLEIAAKAHLFAATEVVTDAVEFTELSLHGNLLKPPWDARLTLPLEDGCLPVPDGPGLGVEMDGTQVVKATAGTATA